ncbi:MAG: NADP-dependent oxidoreductase [Immundisolibacteraceae bacterium]|nr:NADP-dependent oxidoreductase [Immundisolibacteraceae bacterium]
MKAIVFEEYGDSSVLKFTDAPMPPIKADQVLIKVRAAAINPIDWRIRSGGLAKFVECDFPVIPGREVAGVVEQVGADVSRFIVGDEVFGFLQQMEMKWGSCAEYVPADAHKLAHKPAGVSHEQATALPVSVHTAQQALFTHAGLESGQTVLIHAAAGAVGAMAVQLAKLAGATVIATASPENHDYVLGLGADRVVDYHQQNFADQLTSEYPNGVNVILAPFAGKALQGSEPLVTTNTKIILLSPVPTPEDMKIGPVESQVIICQADGAALESLSDQFSSGQLKARIAKVFDLEQTAEAQDLSSTERVAGKIVLTIK